MFGRVARSASSKKAATSLLAAPPSQQVRRLNLHEFQSLEIMKTFGVATPQGIPASTPAEAEAAFNKIKAGRSAYCIVAHLLWRLRTDMCVCVCAEQREWTW